MALMAMLFGVHASGGPDPPPPGQWSLDADSQYGAMESQAQFSDSQVVITFSGGVPQQPTAINSAPRVSASIEPDDDQAAIDKDKELDQELAQRIRETEKIVEEEKLTLAEQMAKYYPPTKDLRPINCRCDNPEDPAYIVKNYKNCEMSDDWKVEHEWAQNKGCKNSDYIRCFFNAPDLYEYLMLQNLHSTQSQQYDDVPGIRAYSRFVDITISADQRINCKCVEGYYEVVGNDAARDFCSRARNTNYEMDVEILSDFQTKFIVPDFDDKELKEKPSVIHNVRPDTFLTSQPGVLQMPMELLNPHHQAMTYEHALRTLSQVPNLLTVQEEDPLPAPLDQMRRELDGWVEEKTPVEKLATNIVERAKDFVKTMGVKESDDTFEALFQNVLTMLDGGDFEITSKTSSSKDPATEAKKRKWKRALERYNGEIQKNADISAFLYQHLIVTSKPTKFFLWGPKGPAEKSINGKKYYIDIITVLTILSRIHATANETKRKNGIISYTLFRNGQVTYDMFMESLQHQGIISSRNSQQAQAAQAVRSGTGRTRRDRDTADSSNISHVSESSDADRMPKKPKNGGNTLVRLNASSVSNTTVHVEDLQERSNTTAGFQQMGSRGKKSQQTQPQNRGDLFRQWEGD
jgi:hypothetical protein